MKTTILALLLTMILAGAPAAQHRMPVVAVHLEKSSMRNCESSLPLPELEDVNTTYGGVGEVDALIILYNFTETRGFSLALDWPEAWGMGRWSD